MSPAVAEDMPIVAIEKLSNSLQKLDKEKLSNLQQLNRKLEVLMLEGVIVESDYFESAKDINEISSLANKVSNNEDELLKTHYIDLITDILFKLLNRHKKQSSLGFYAEIKALANEFKIVSILSEIIHYFYLFVEHIEEDPCLGFLNKLKTIEKIEELIGNYYSYIPCEVIEAIKNIIEVNLHGYLEFGSLLTVEDLRLPKNEVERRELIHLDKEIKYIVGYVSSLLEKRQEEKLSSDASEYLQKLFYDYSIDFLLVDILAETYPNIRFSVGIIFFICLVFSKPDIPVEEIVYQSLGENQANVWTVMNNASREQRYIIYQQEKLVIRAFPDSLIDFRVIDVNNFHNEFGNIDNSYQRITSPFYAE